MALPIGTSMFVLPPCKNTERGSQGLVAWLVREGCKKASSEEYGAKTPTNLAPVTNHQQYISSSNNGKPSATATTANHQQDISSNNLSTSD
eukprot:scaffold613_cov325-Pavlova_lutheri.AAC.1